MLGQMIHKLMSTMRRVEWEPRISRAVLPSSASAVRHVHAFREILGDFPKMLCIFEWKKESRRDSGKKRFALVSRIPEQNFFFAVAETFPECHDDKQQPERA